MFKRHLKSEQTDRRTDTLTDGHFDLQKALAQIADALKIQKTSFVKGIETILSVADS